MAGHRLGKPTTNWVWAVAALVAAIALAGCGNQGTLAGHAFRCSGFGAGAPVQVEVLSGSRVVASTTTAADGSYTMTLPTGTYAAQAPATNPAGQNRTVRVVVQSDTTVEADFPNYCI